MLSNRVIAKAPGKVLIAGGYGVLEEGNFGLALAVDNVVSHQHQTSIQVRLYSPQINGKWDFTFNSANASLKQDNNLTNPFLENAIKYSLIYAYQSSPQIKATSIEVILLQDRGFLSENQSQTNSKFIKYGKDSTKTGLGSSAAVIVVTVQGILRQLLKEVGKHLINAVSQVANLAAQNKIGSNFDISTAVFGSHLYTNILPENAYTVASSHDFKTLLGIDPQIKSLEPACERLRRGYCCMVDLKQGSNTRKMVSGFIKSLNQQSQNTITEFYHKSKYYVREIYSLIVEEGDFNSLKSKMKDLNSQYRKFIQTYSSITKIPVEPPQLQPFLDRICDIPRVVYSICPGSGGYDAIFVLTSAQSVQQTEQVKCQLDSVVKQHNLKSSISAAGIIWKEQQVSSSELAAISSFLW